VPVINHQTVTESGRPASQSDGVTFLRFEPGAAVYRVASGVYQFDSRIGLN
jgi:alpha-L-rhamnosidase